MHLLHHIIFSHCSSGELVVVASMKTAMALGLNDDADRLLLWIVDHQGHLGCLDIRSAECSVIGRLGITMKEIGFDEQGRLIGCNGTDTYLIDTGNARVTLLDAIPSHRQALSARAGSATAWQKPELLASCSTHSFGDGATKRNATELAFDMARFFMNNVLGHQEQFVQLAVLNGHTLEIGVFGHGPLYGRAKSQISLLHTQGARIYTTNSATGHTTPVSDYPGTTQSLFQRPKIVCTES